MITANATTIFKDGIPIGFFQSQWRLSQALYHLKKEERQHQPLSLIEKVRKENLEQKRKEQEKRQQEQKLKVMGLVNQVESKLKSSQKITTEDIKVFQMLK